MGFTDWFRSSDDDNEDDKNGYYEYDRNHESEEDKLFKNDFEMPMDEYTCVEMEKKLHSKEFAERCKKLIEDEEKNPSDKNKMMLLMTDMVIKVLYRASKDPEAFHNMLKETQKTSISMSEINPFTPAKIDSNKGTNMTPYYLFGLWQRGLIYDKNNIKEIEKLYYKHRDFHKNIGEDSFKSFMCLIGIGIVRADMYYEKNMKDIINEQIEYLEKEMNKGKDITL